MINYFFVEPNGKIAMTGNCLEEDLHLQSFYDAELIVGVADLDKNYYKEGVIKEFTARPSEFYKWNYALEAWEFDYDYADTAAKKQRDKLLADGPDRISPMWWSSMTQEQQQQWTNYRQALLDVTEQINYPEHIVWPTKPE